MWREDGDFLFDMYLLDMWDMEDEKDKLKKARNDAEKAKRDAFKRAKRSKRPTVSSSSNKDQEASGILTGIVIVLAAVGAFVLWLFEVVKEAALFAWEHFLCWSWQYVLAGLLVFFVAIITMNWKD